MKYDNSVPDCRAMHLASSEAEPYYAMTIEFNWKTNEALAIIQETIHFILLLKRQMIGIGWLEK